MINYYQRVKQAFNQAVHSYDNHCDVQLKVGSELIRHLKDKEVKPRLAIDLGCGTGLITEQLIATLEPDLLYAIDFADALLARARKRLNAYNVKLEQGDFQSLNYINTFDLVFSNMAIHWTSSLFTMLKQLHSNLLPKGILAFSIPLFETFHELSAFNKHEFYTKNTIEQWLCRSDYKILTAQSLRCSYVFQSLRQALKSIKAVGAHSVPLKKTHVNYQSIKRILKHNPSRFELTYHVGIFIGQKVL